MIEITQLCKDSVSSALDKPGAFCWWYADLTDSQGSGCVLVWSFGLPFLPGSRKQMQALSRPAVHVALYEQGRPLIYLLQEYSPQEADIDPHTGCGRIGNSHFSLTHSDQKTQLSVELNLPVPHSKKPFIASLVIDGPNIVLGTNHKPISHAWIPQTIHAQGSLVWNWDQIHGALSGRAYVDANLSSQSLHLQGIQSWRWGRLSFSDRCFVYYDILGDNGSHTQFVAQQTAESFSMVDAKVQFSEEKAGRYGLTSPRKISLTLPEEHIRLNLTHLVDDGPFYQRFVLDGSSFRKNKQEHAHGIAEVVKPSKVDIPWQRPFVRMKTHRVGGTNSIWLPVFSGHKKARLSRLLRSISRGGFRA